MAITSADIDAAAARLAGRVRRTPVVELELGALIADSPAALKLEFMQHSGSFKPRGMFNRILSAVETGELSDAGVVTASGGNAGLAVAYAASSLGVPAEVFVPLTAPEFKTTKLRALGATVVAHGNEYAEAYDRAITRAADTGALFCHAYDQPEVVAGQGTLGLELLKQLDPAPDTVVIAAGGGGLVAGVAVALAGRCKVLAAEPETCPTLHAALAAGEPVDIDVSGVAADSLGARRIGTIAFDIALRTNMRSVLISDQAIIAARRWLWDRSRLVIEHGSAAALAAVLSERYRPDPGERLAIVLCGANTDPSDLTSPIEDPRVTTSGPELSPSKRPGG
jgi:threonine dehydratase